MSTRGVPREWPCIIYVYILHAHIMCARRGLTAAHVPHATGSHAHPVRIPTAGGGAGAVVGLGEGKNVVVVVVGGAVVGVAVAAILNRSTHSGHTTRTAASTTREYHNSGEVLQSTPRWPQYP